MSNRIAHKKADIPLPVLRRSPVVAAIAGGLPIARTHLRSIPTAFYVVLFLVGMVALWSILCTISHRSPDADNIEELLWASSFEWGYYKHPPMPTWILYPLTLLFGKSIWLTFFAGQLSSALALWFVWKLGCEFTTSRRALIAMLMVSVTAYFSLRATIYNHNSAQMWSIVASTWLYYRALRYHRTLDWFWLGVACAAAVLTKYSAIIQFAAFFVFFVWHGNWRDRRALAGALIALTSFSVVMVPHLYWLLDHRFEPVLYANNSIVTTPGEHFRVGVEFLGFLNTQLGRLSPLFVAWAALFLWNRRTAGTQDALRAADGTHRYAQALSEWDRSFLLIVGLAPVTLTLIATAILGTHLGSSWGSTFFVFFGFYTYWWLAGDERVNLWRTVVVVVVIQLVLAAGYAVGRGPLAFYTGYKTNSTYPGAAISHRMQTIWREYVPGAPLTLIAANTWLGGNVAVHMHKSANVFIDADLKKSPWLEEHDIKRCGMLIAFSNGDHGAEPSAAVRRLYEAAPYKGTFEQRWSVPGSFLLEIHWAIIPPSASCHGATNEIR